VAPDPVARPGQGVVDVSVAPVLMLETQRWRGWSDEWFTVKPLYELGVGVAGEVISVGENMNPAWVGRSESFPGTWGGCAAPVEDLDY
jgi:NADPH2:quinone reductase